MKPIPTISALTAPVAVAAVLLAGCATEPDAFAIADTSKDGRISPKEFERFMLEAIYTEVDADGDSRVTLAEYTAANPSANAARYKAVDKNGDGVITPAEAEAFSDAQGTMTELFKKIDSNGDGSLSRSEVETFYTQVVESEGSTSLEKLSNAAAE